MQLLKAEPTMLEHDLHFALQDDSVVADNGLDGLAGRLNDGLDARDTANGNGARSARLLVEEGVDGADPDDGVHRDTVTGTLEPDHADGVARVEVELRHDGAVSSLVRRRIGRKDSLDHDVHDATEVNDIGQLPVVERDVLDVGGHARELAADVVELVALLDDRGVNRALEARDRERQVVLAEVLREQQCGGTTCVAAELAAGHLEVAVAQNQEAGLFGTVLFHALAERLAVALVLSSAEGPLDDPDGGSVTTCGGNECVSWTHNISSLKSQFIIR